MKRVNMKNHLATSTLSWNQKNNIYNHGFP